MDKRAAPGQILGYINQLKLSYSDLRKVYIFGSFVKGSASFRVLPCIPWAKSTGGGDNE
jgi:hypothetical protein